MVITVGTSVNCDSVDFNAVYHEAMLRHNVMGCQFIQLLKFIYNINVTYVIFDSNNVDEDYVEAMLRNGSIDVYARPIALRTGVLDFAYPVQSILMWRVGFLLRREPKQQMLSRYYRKPFNHTVWSCLFFMTLLAAVVFFTLSHWEKHLGLNRDCSFFFELLLAIGGFCQHIFPVETTTISRRTAYFVFFLFTFVIYTCYTSNLLSHLVSDKQNQMDLPQLAESGYQYMILEGIKRYQIQLSQPNISILLKDIEHIPIVNVSTGIEAVRTNKTALLSDYAIVYREIIKSFSNKEICDIVEVDLFSRVRKYLVTSKEFRYKEQMKVSIIRIKEAGIQRRLTGMVPVAPLECSLPIEVTTTLEQISALLLLLFCSYILSFLLLVCEILYFRRYRLWPYVE